MNKGNLCRDVEEIFGKRPVGFHVRKKLSAQNKTSRGTESHRRKKAAKTREAEKEVREAVTQKKP